MSHGLFVVADSASLLPEETTMRDDLLTQHTLEIVGQASVSSASLGGKNFAVVSGETSSSTVNTNVGAALAASPVPVMTLNDGSGLVPTLGIAFGTITAYRSSTSNATQTIVSGTNYTAGYSGDVAFFSPSSGLSQLRTAQLGDGAIRVAGNGGATEFSVVVYERGAVLADAAGGDSTGVAAPGARVYIGGQNWQNRTVAFRDIMLLTLSRNIGGQPVVMSGGYAESPWTDLGASGTEVTASLTWGTSALLVVLGATEGSNKTMGLPTATGAGTFTQRLYSNAVADSCNVYAWTAAPAGAGASAITSTNTGAGANDRSSGLAAWAFTSHGGLGASLVSVATSLTRNLTVQGPDSTVVAVLSDWNATSDVTVTTVPAGGTIREVSTVSGRNTSLVIEWVGQQAGTRAYGGAGWTGTGNISVALLEVKGTSGPVAFTGTAAQSAPAQTQAASGTAAGPAAFTGTAAQSAPAQTQAASGTAAGPAAFTGTAAQSAPAQTQAASGAAAGPAAQPVTVWAGKEADRGITIPQAANADGALTVGMEVEVVGTPVTVDAVGFYAGTGFVAGGTLRGQIREVPSQAGVAGTFVDFPAISGVPGWQWATFAAPVELPVGVYRVCVFLPAGGYPAQSSYFDVGAGSSGFDDGALHTRSNTEAPSGQMLFAYGGAITYPTTAFNATWYGVDVRQPGAAGGTDVTGTVAQTAPAQAQAASGTSTAPAGPVTGTVAQAAPAQAQASSGTSAHPLDEYDDTYPGTAAFTGTVAQSGKAATQAATGTATVPAFTGTVAQSGKAATQAAAGTATVPAFTGTVAQSGKAATQAAAGTSTVPTDTGTVAQTAPAMTQAAVGTVTLPAVTGTVAQEAPPATQAATGTTVGPAFTGTAAQTSFVPTQSAAGTSAAPAFTGTVAQAGFVPTQSAAGTVTVPAFTGAVAQAAPAATQAAVGVRTVDPNTLVDITASAVGPYVLLVATSVGPDDGSRTLHSQGPSA